MSPIIAAKHRALRESLKILAAVRVRRELHEGPRDSDDRGAGRSKGEDLEQLAVDGRILRPRARIGNQ